MANFAFHGVASGTPQTIELVQTDEVVTVINRGTAELYFTVSSSGVAPTTAAVTGVDTYVVPGVNGAQVSVPIGGAKCEVSVVSSGTPAFSVVGGLTTAVSET